MKTHTFLLTRFFLLVFELPQKNKKNLSQCSPCLTLQAINVDIVYFRADKMMAPHHKSLFKRLGRWVLVHLYKITHDVTWTMINCWAKCHHSFLKKTKTVHRLSVYNNCSKLKEYFWWRKKMNKTKKVFMLCFALILLANVTITYKIYSRNLRRRKGIHVLHHSKINIYVFFTNCFAW